MATASSDATQAFRARFDIVKELGRGGMGEVYLAHDRYTQRDVAIKMTRLALMDDPEVGSRLRKMWINETRLAGKLRHPCIAEIYESGVADDFGYLVMEYVTGTTLKPYARPDQLLPPERVIEIVYKVCNALDYAYRCGLLHRDIKPANVMLTDDGAVKVMDFGTCYFTGSDETQVFDVGTLPYMPPEHFKRRTPTVQSDIYAVGVMTYQLLTGTLPFNAQSQEAMIYQKLNSDFVALDARRKDLPGGLRFIVHRAIHPDPETRYASWSQLCDDFALALPQVDRAHEVVFETARFNTLRRLPFFAAFSDAELWEAVHLSTWTEHAAAELICAEGSIGDRIYFVAKGDAEVLRDGVVLNTLGVGDCFGEIAYIEEEGSVRSASVAAASPMLLVEIEVGALRDASAALQAAFNRAFMHLLVNRLKRADRRYLDTVQAKNK